MGLFDKVKDLAGEHADKVGDAIDKVAQVVDEKSGGKFAEHIDRGAEAAKDYVDHGRPGDGGPPPEPPRA